MIRNSSHMHRSKYILILITITSLCSAWQIKYDIEDGITKANLFELSVGLTSDYDDGPYIFITGENKGISKSIVNGKVLEKEIEIEIAEFLSDSTTYDNISQIAVLSDIHGQLDVLKRILNSNGIIDDNYNWSFGNGHFVIVGDIFDRGHQVTETLWFVYELEKQAKVTGGKVHYLLGNHEYMVLNEDLRYLHDKYKQTEALLNTSYTDLFSNETVLGRWLRSKSTVITINDIIFVHGGLSQEFVDLNLSLDDTNKLFRESIDLTKDEIKQSEIYYPLYSATGPIWYRGYFIDAIPKTDVGSILDHFKAKNIVVGHTSYSKIKMAYDGLVYVVDSSIKNGKTGEILLIENGTFYRGKANGKRVRLSQTL